MAESPLSIEQTGVTSPATRKRPNAILRLLRYTLLKIITLGAAVVIGVYLTILVANMGGYVDEIMKGQIQEQVMLTVSMDPKMKVLSQAERTKIIENRIQLEVERLNLDEPFIKRSFLPAIPVQDRCARSFWNVCLQPCF